MAPLVKSLQVQINSVNRRKTRKQNKKTKQENIFFES